jgi:hypothetical protein
MNWYDVEVLAYDATALDCGVMLTVLIGQH